jgi:hypothetical protein
MAHAACSDEADLVLGYGYTDDVQTVLAALPVSRQTFLMSATLGSDVQQLQTQALNRPALVKVEEEEEPLKEDALLHQLSLRAESGTPLPAVPATYCARSPLCPSRAQKPTSSSSSTSCLSCSSSPASRWCSSTRFGRLVFLLFLFPHVCCADAAETRTPRSPPHHTTTPHNTIRTQHITTRSAPQHITGVQAEAAAAVLLHPQHNPQQRAAGKLPRPHFEPIQQQRVPVAHRHRREPGHARRGGHQRDGELLGAR